MLINILKCHGSGNDFILIDEWSNAYNFSEEQRVILSQTLCDRKSSLGSDGILFFTKSDKVDAGMRMFNTDGSEAEMCGNGLRCLARYALELLKKDKALIETLKENLEVEKIPDIFQGVKTFKVAIKPVRFQLETLPMIFPKETLRNEKIQGLSEELLFTALSIPNPHIVTIVDTIDEKAIEEIGIKANLDKNIFPRGVNLNFVKPLGENIIYVQTYERGVGLTNACGTGMSSASLVSCLLGINKIDSVITVVNRGGMVKCQPKVDKLGNYSVELMGNATYTFQGEVEFNYDYPLDFVYTNEKDYLEDINNYNKLAEYAKDTL
ncbi:MAG: diaminopimelate epimerase [Clostridiaceae bacterium]|nr:diaminopimelate epimerase [Clostridiaceae bacterium]